jgi:hypothetical protein
MLYSLFFCYPLLPPDPDLYTQNEKMFMLCATIHFSGVFPQKKVLCCAWEYFLFMLFFLTLLPSRFMCSCEMNGKQFRAQKTKRKMKNQFRLKCLLSSFPSNPLPRRIAVFKRCREIYTNRITSENKYMIA